MSFSFCSAVSFFGLLACSPPQIFEFDNPYPGIRVPATGAVYLLPERAKIVSARLEMDWCTFCSCIRFADVIQALYPDVDDF
jgi:hypothetical protein